MKKIVVYGLSTCPWCRKTKQYFADMQIDFDYTNYDLANQEEQSKIMQNMKELGGGNAFPFIKIGEEVIIGYNPDKFSTLLKSNK
ncbi:glutaredoxin family protein [[Eubacterium] cellulosolvens]